MTRRRSFAGPVVAVVAVLALAVPLTGCTSTSSTSTPASGPAPGPAQPTAAPASPLATCEDLAAPPDGLADGATASAPAHGLPALTLPCFTGGEPFTLSDLHGPAIVNLWASWCPPCRDELPILQRLADSTASQVHILGVITEDRATAAASLADDLDLTFPSLDDPDRVLMRTVGLTGLPTTLYVAATGELVYYHQGPLDEETLIQQVRDHLGLTV